MKKFVFFILSSLSIASVFSCEINTYSNIVFLQNTNLKTNQAYKKSNCSEKINKLFLEYLKESQGTIETKNLVRYLKNPDMKITPARIAVRSLRNILINELNFDNNYKWETLNEVNNQLIIAYDHEDDIRFLCRRCNHLGKNNLKVLINRYNGKKNVFWVKGNILSQVKSFVATRDLPALKSINPSSDFREEVIYSKKPSDFLIDKDILKYSKLSRSINKGLPLQRNQIIPIKLVKAGAVVNVNLKSDQIQLSSKAAAINSGKLNDIIRVRNFKTGRVIQGRIVDYNKIEVELWKRLSA